MAFFYYYRIYSIKIACPTLKALNQHRFDLLGYSVYKAMKLQ